MGASEPEARLRAVVLGHPTGGKFKLAEERKRERQQGRRRVDPHLGMV